MPATSGYSGKPLFQKLGLKPGMTCLTIGAPENYENLIEGAEDVRVSARVRSADVIHAFCRSRRELEKVAPKALAARRTGSMIWISWPKKSSSMFVDLTEDGVREVMLPTGWVDVKVCAVDEDWSGLKFLKRRET